jgi:hypothetical protein
MRLPNNPTGERPGLLRPGEDIDRLRCSGFWMIAPQRGLVAMSLG